MKSDNPLTAHRIRLIMSALAACPLCAHDLAPKVFLCYAQAWRYLKELHDLGQVHIAKWALRRTESRVYHVACYAAGPGRDAKQPPRLTSAQRQARSRAKIRADDDRYDLFKAKNRASKRKPARDPLVAAMFGAPAQQEARDGAH